MQTNFITNIHRQLSLECSVVVRSAHSLVASVASPRTSSYMDYILDTSHPLLYTQLIYYASFTQSIQTYFDHQIFINMKLIFNFILIFSD